VNSRGPSALRFPARRDPSHQLYDLFVAEFVGNPFLALGVNTVSRLPTFFHASQRDRFGAAAIAAVFCMDG